MKVDEANAAVAAMRRLWDAAARVEADGAGALPPQSRFDAFALRADQDFDEALTAFDDFTVRYQPAADEPLPLYRRRG